MNSDKKIVWSATPTPFTADGKIDVKSLERLVDQHLLLGVEGLFLAGSCGEGPFMPDEQRVGLVREVKRLAAGRMHIAAQVSDTSAARVKINIARMQDAGADTVVIAPPWIGRFCNAEFAKRYFFESIEAASVQVGIYILNTPDAHALDHDMWTRVASHPKVKLVKDSSASADFVRILVDLKKRRKDLLVMTGYEFGALNATAAGYDGVLLGTGIMTAGMIRRGLIAQASGDDAGAESWQDCANRFLFDLFGKDLSLWLGGLKYALVRLGVFDTEFMHLGYKLTTEDRVRIDTALAREAALIKPSNG